MGCAYYISLEVNGRIEHALGYGHNAKGVVEIKGLMQHIQHVPSWFNGDRLNERSAGVFL